MTLWEAKECKILSTGFPGISPLWFQIVTAWPGSMSILIPDDRCAAKKKGRRGPNVRDRDALETNLSTRSLERELGSELNDSRRMSSENLAESSGRDIVTHLLRIELRVVPHVEELHTHFKRSLLRDLGVLGELEIKIVEPQSMDRAPVRVSKDTACQ